VSAAPRDREALELVAQRSFAGSAIVEMSLEMLARRLRLRVYGKIRAGDDATYSGALTFFGVSALSIWNESGIFPESVRLAEVALSYSDPDDEGSCRVTGGSGWTMDWRFDGIAYEENPAVLASLHDDL
jgi:hypothetical protein